MNPAINLAAGRIDHINERPLPAGYTPIGIPRNAENDRWQEVARQAGVCMTCALGTPETFGCSDCLNTGWEQGTPGNTFQDRVAPWTVTCFGPVDAVAKPLRSFRFLEEGLELVQATGTTRAEVLELVDYVYGRPVGELTQEVGGVMVTVAALCNAHGIDMHQLGERELARVQRPEMIKKIRAKHEAKPKFGSRPVAAKTWRDEWPEVKRQLPGILAVSFSVSIAVSTVKMWLFG